MKADARQFQPVGGDAKAASDDGRMVGGAVAPVEDEAIVLPCRRAIAAGARPVVPCGASGRPWRTVVAPLLGSSMVQWPASSRVTVRRTESVSLSVSTSCQRSASSSPRRMPVYRARRHRAVRSSLAVTFRNVQIGGNGQGRRHSLELVIPRLSVLRISSHQAAMLPSLRSPCVSQALHQRWNMWGARGQWNGSDGAKIAHELGGARTTRHREGQEPGFFSSAGR